MVRDAIYIKKRNERSLLKILKNILNEYLQWVPHIENGILIIYTYVIQIKLATFPR